MTSEIEIKQKLDFLKNNKLEIEKTTSVREVYALIDKTNDVLKTFYTGIGCKDNCFLCCQHTNIPSVTQLEWELTFEQLKSMSEKDQAKIISKNKKLFSSYGTELKKIHNILNSDGNPTKLKELAETLPKFQGTSCIFLDKGSCSIYDSRPSKCRTQGSSIVKYDNTVQFQSCLPEVLKMEEVFKKQGHRKSLMHYSNNYEDKIKDFHPENKILVSIFPVWILSHTADNTFVSEVNLKPDFDSALANF